ncbi:MAG: FtsL-like putative cell division protein [Saprospiraceae bacterium]
MNLPFVCYLALLCVVYIFNINGVEKKLRKIEVLRSEVKDANWRYMDIKQGVMYGSTQSQIEKKVAGLNLKPIRKAPFRITDSN